MLEMIAQIHQDNLDGKNGVVAAIKENARQAFGNTEVGKMSSSKDSTSTAISLASSELTQFISQINSVVMILNPLKTILQGVFQILTPLINTALAPLVGVLVVMSSILCKLVRPSYR